MQAHSSTYYPAFKIHGTRCANLDLVLVAILQKMRTSHDMKMAPSTALIGNTLLEVSIICRLRHLRSSTGQLRFLGRRGRSSDDRKSLYGGPAANNAFIQPTIPGRGASLASWSGRSPNRVYTCCQLVVPNAAFVSNEPLEITLVRLLPVQSCSKQ